MTDLKHGWVYGFQTTLDRRWNLVDPAATEYVNIGGQLTAALAYLRVHQQTGSHAHLEAARDLSRVIERGWDEEHGCWLDQVRREAPYTFHPQPRVQWWIHIYGAFLHLRLYAITGKTSHLQRFLRSEQFYTRHFIDHEQGGGFASLTMAGDLADEGGKAAPWHTSYHDVEHGLINYLLLSLYVNREPVTLHFLFTKGSAVRRYVSLVDDPAVIVDRVTVDGESFTAFNPQDRSVKLPNKSGPIRMQVSLRLP